MRQNICVFGATFGCAKIDSRFRHVWMLFSRIDFDYKLML